jgi:plasmid stabilization system protein ParE
MAEASDWYDARNKGLGDAFLRAFDAATDSISRNPMQYQVIFASARRVGLGKFPYALIYTVIDDQVIVLSCTHTRRDPRRWQSQLP